MQDADNLLIFFNNAKSAWPTVRLPFERFTARAHALDVTAEALQERCVDVYLAFACAEGDPAAVKAFEDIYISQIPGYVGRFALPPHLLDEVTQVVRVKQLLGATPGISRYSGRGALGSWVRVSAVHAAVDIATSEGAAPASSSLGLLDVLASLDDGPEIATIKKLSSVPLLAAIEASMANLGARDKTLLRLQVVDELNIDAIGAIYRVHRATVARWLVAIRATILADLRARLSLDWAPTTTELRSVVRLLRSQVHLSAKRILRDR
jgi:RNA polymerase sigma-70 factor (ECF subfamily)